MTQPAPLRTLLRRWRHEPAPAPEFALGVWARLESTRRRDRTTSAFRWVLPLAASLALVVGIGAARFETRRAHAERMADFYVRTIDPVQMVAHQDHR
jgi:hypothetical protein